MRVGGHLSTACLATLVTLASVLLTTTSSSPSSSLSSTSTPQPRHSVTLAVLLPRDDRWMFSLGRVVPALRVAVDTVYSTRMLPDYVDLFIAYGDSDCSPVAGPLSAFALKRRASVFLGPFCDYSLSPIARYAPVWDIPVVTPGGMAHDFGADKLVQFRTLTRVGANFNSLSWALYHCLRPSGFKRVKILYTPSGHGEVVDRFCYLAISAFVRRIKKLDIEYHLFLFRANTDLGKMFRDEVGRKYAGKPLPAYFVILPSITFHPMLPVIPVHAYYVRS